MNKTDKKFISAIVILHTGVIVLTISVSGYFWHHQTIKVQKLNQLHELVEFVKDTNNEIGSQQKIEALKKHYETKGVSVE